MESLAAEPLWLANPPLRWLLAAAVAAGVFLGLLALRRVAVRALARLTARTATRYDDLLLDLAKRTRGLFLLAVGLAAGAASLDLPAAAELAARRLGVLVVLLQVVSWADYVLRFALERQIARRGASEAADLSALGLMGFLGRVGIWSLAVLVALDNFGIEITALVAGLGVGGIVAGLALRNVLEDVFASLSIVLDRPFEIGEVIKVGAFVGTVERIGIKTTRLRSVDGEELVFGNDDLLSSRIQNFGSLRERRATLRFGLSYATPPEKLEAVPAMLREIVEAEPGTRFERAHFTGLGTSSLDFECVYWVLDPSYTAFMDVRQRVQLALYRRLSEAGIDFAYPPLAAGRLLHRRQNRSAARRSPREPTSLGRATDEGPFGQGLVKGRFKDHPHSLSLRRCHDRVWRDADVDVPFHLAARATVDDFALGVGVGNEPVTFLVGQVFRREHTRDEVQLAVLAYVRFPGDHVDFHRPSSRGEAKSPARAEPCVILGAGDRPPAPISLLFCFCRSVPEERFGPDRRGVGDGTPSRSRGRTMPGVGRGGRHPQACAEGTSWNALPRVRRPASGQSDRRGSGFGLSRVRNRVQVRRGPVPRASPLPGVGLRARPQELP